MKVLQFHNEYVFPGGEDAVASSEAVLLRSFGHAVIEFRRSNKALNAFSLAAKMHFCFQGIYFQRAIFDAVTALIEQEKPDIAHFHNSFFMIGPAAYEACFAKGVPVVQTLHNYRFLCAVATFFRNGQTCEECLAGGRMTGIRYGCWHGSRLMAWAMTRAIEEYEKRNILGRISQFIALSDFSRRKFIQAGWDGERIVVKPNFLEQDPRELGEWSGERGDRREEIRDVDAVVPRSPISSLSSLGSDLSAPGYVLYVGALQPYKGVATLLKAWSKRNWPVPLKIVGSGPIEAELKSLNVPGVEWLGQVSSAEVIKLIKGAACVVVPSECYENFPRVIIEAFACGVPVVASRLGAMAEIIEEGKSGFLFPPGQADDLALVLEHILSDAQLSQSVGKAARLVFESRYTPQSNYLQLQDIYRQVLAIRSS